jgi:hypothetical protein
MAFAAMANDYTSNKSPNTPDKVKKGNKKIVGLTSCSDSPNSKYCNEEYKVYKSLKHRPFSLSRHPIYDDQGGIIGRNKNLSADDEITVLTANPLKDLNGEIILNDNGEVVYEQTIMNAGKYYKFLNQLEVNLNQKGLSLRNSSYDKYQSSTKEFKQYLAGLVGDESSEEGATIGRMKIRRSLYSKMLDRQESFLRDHDRSEEILNAANEEFFSSTTGLNIDGREILDPMYEVLQIHSGDSKMYQRNVEIDEEVFTSEAMEQHAVASLARDEEDQSSTPPKDTHVSKSYSNEWGDRGSFGVSLNIDSEASTTGATKAYASNFVESKIYIFGSSKRVLNAETYASSTHGTRFQGYYEVNVGNDPILSDNQVEAAPFSQNASSSHSVSKAKNIRFMLAGFIPMNVRVYGSGEVGALVVNKVFDSAVVSQIYPSVNIDAGAELEVDLLIAAAGVGANLKIVEEDLAIDAKAQITSRTGQYIGRSVVSTYSNTSTLNGRLYIYVDIKPPFRDKRRYSYDLFRWSGITQDGVLFSDSDSVSIF